MVSSDAVIEAWYLTVIAESASSDDGLNSATHFGEPTVAGAGGLVFHARALLLSHVMVL